MGKIDLRYDDYAQSANTIFNFMKKSEYLKEILEKKAIIPRYCKENLEYLNIHNGDIAFRKLWYYRSVFVTSHFINLQKLFT